MKFKRRVGLLMAGLITIFIISFVEDRYVYGNNDNFKVAQMKEECGIRDLANILSKSKFDMNEIISINQEKEVLNEDAYISFDYDNNLISSINVLFKESGEDVYRIIYEKLWNELGNSSSKYITSDGKLIEVWEKGNIEISFNKDKENLYITIE